MHITFVKKILANGEPCQKCRDVEQRLITSGHIQQIDETVIADERDIESAGMKLAVEVNVTRAPFFVVDTDDGTRKVYTVYFKFAKEILNREQSNKDEGKEV